MATQQKPFVITVSARALFDLEEDHDIFVKQGEAAFREHQLLNEDKLLKPGTAFPLVKKILDLNNKLPDGARPFEVVLLSRNSPETGVRVFKTMAELELPIHRSIFTRGASTSNYIKAIGVDLFLSTNPEEVRKVIDMGVAAATLIPKPTKDLRNDDHIRLAFDGDSVLFSDESEKVYAKDGLKAFQEHEVKFASVPLPDGPMRSFLEAINLIQRVFPEDDCPIRTALITARSSREHRRALVTLRSWGVRVDEGMFLSGQPKGLFVKAFGADFFFDDSRKNIQDAMDNDIACGHVPYGARNAEGADESNFTGGSGPVGATPPKEKKKSSRAPRP